MQGWLQIKKSVNAIRIKRIGETTPMIILLDLKQLTKINIYL